MSWKYRNDEIDTPSQTGRASAAFPGGIDWQTAAGGLRPPAAMFATGGNPAQLAADGVNSTPVITEIYVASVLVPFTCLVTGISVFNGSVVATDKYKVGLFGPDGVLLRASAAAGFQPTATDAYEDVVFALDGAGVAATTYVARSGLYYVGVIYNGTTNRFNAHGVGRFPTARVTGAVFATAFSTTSLALATLPTTFTTTDLPPIASLY